MPKILSVWDENTLAEASGEPRCFGGEWFVNLRFFRRTGENELTREGGAMGVPLEDWQATDEVEIPNGVTFIYP